MIRAYTQTQQMLLFEVDPLTLVSDWREEKEKEEFRTEKQRGSIKKRTSGMLGRGLARSM